MLKIARCLNCGGEGQHESHHNGDFSDCYSCSGHGYLYAGATFPKEQEVDEFGLVLVTPCCWHMKAFLRQHALEKIGLAESLKQQIKANEHALVKLQANLKRLEND